MRDRRWTIFPFLLVTMLRAQPCDGRGSEMRPAHWEAGLPLSCVHAPDAPGYRLFTPAHREVVPRAGSLLGEAHVRAQWIVRYRCTGLWILPVVVSEVRNYGVVLDVEEEACAAASQPGVAPKW